MCQSYSDNAVPLVPTVTTALRDRASQRRTVLSPDAVTRRSEFEGCQHSWSTLSVWPRNVLSFDCNKKQQFYIIKWSDEAGIEALPELVNSLIVYIYLHHPYIQKLEMWTNAQRDGNS